MEEKCERNSEPPSACVYELPGEPAVVINGVPDVLMDDGNVMLGLSLANGIETPGTPCNSASHTRKPRNTGFGEWLEGREVQKLFGQTSYSGKVTEFDKETGWYRVVYEDGDFEDLEWHELQDVLQPLDITMPLKALALKIIRKSQISEPGVETNVVSDRKRGGKARGHRGRWRGSSSKNLVGRD